MDSGRKRNVPDVARVKHSGSHPFKINTAGALTLTIFTLHSVYLKGFSNHLFLKC